MSQQAMQVLDLYSLFMNCIQGSEVWRQLRKNSIGGTTAPIVIDEHKYQSRESYINERVNGITRSHTPNIMMAHGNILEDLNRQIAADILGVIIHETGIFISANCMHFSPDGIGIDLIGRPFLAEFKTPYSRRLSKSAADIPNMYKIQIQHSMGQVAFRYCFFQEINVIYLDSRSVSLMNAPNRLNQFREYGNFSATFFVPSLPIDIIHTIEDIKDCLLTDIMNSAIPTGPPSIIYSVRGLNHITDIQIKLYGQPIIRCGVNSEYKSSYSLKTNFILKGLFGPVVSYLVNPDMTLIERLRSGCKKICEQIVIRQSIS